MMMIRKIYISLLFIAWAGVLLSSCGSGDGDVQADKGRWESINSGTLSCYVEDGIFPILEKPIQWYREQYKDVDLTVSVADSRESMKQLFSGNQRVVVTSRGYLRDEDSLMKEFAVKPHLFFDIAKDGLVFFVKNDFPIDTLNDSQIRDILLGRTTFGKCFPGKFDSEPEIFMNSFKSSEYANLEKLVLKDSKPRVKINFTDGPEAVKASVDETENALGIGYLGQVYPDVSSKKFKALMIGWQDSTGAYISPKPVHQAYFVMEKYPYMVTYRAYLLEEIKNLPYWFASYLGKETKVQVYFKESGIVPAFAKFRLIQED